MKFDDALSLATKMGYTPFISCIFEGGFYFFVESLQKNPPHYSNQVVGVRLAEVTSVFAFSKDPTRELLKIVKAPTVEEQLLIEKHGDWKVGLQCNLDRVFDPKDSIHKPVVVTELNG